MNDLTPFHPAATGPVRITVDNWEAIAAARGYPAEWRKHLAAYVTNNELQAEVALIHERFMLADDGETILRRKTGTPVKPRIHEHYLEVSEKIERKVRNFRVNRIVFALRRGWTAPQIDHANRQKLDNSIGNLRPADSTQNAMNAIMGARRRDPRLGSCIYRGTATRPRVEGGDFYWVRIQTKGEKVWIAGPFETHEQAQVARDAEQTRRHGSFYLARYARKSSKSPSRGRRQ